MARPIITSDYHDAPCPRCRCSIDSDRTDIGNEPMSFICPFCGAKVWTESVSILVCSLDEDQARTTRLRLQPKYWDGGTLNWDVEMARRRVAAARYPRCPLKVHRGAQEYPCVLAVGHDGVCQHDLEDER